MKKALLTLALTLALAVPVFAAEDDITKVEVRPDVTAYKLDTVKFLVFTQTAEITYRKVDASGNSVGEEVSVFFRNVTDDPTTEDVDETLTEFTQLISAINSGDNIKNTIASAVRIKLGI